MEILFVSHKYPPAVGGMEKHSFELIQGMSKICKIHAIVFDGSESRSSFFMNLQKRIVQKLKDFPSIKIIHFNDGLLASFCSFHTQYSHIAQTATLHGLDVVFPSQLFRTFILPRFNKYKALICVSEETAKRTISFGIKPEIVFTIPNGVDIDIPKAESLPENLTNKKYLVLMGRPVKRKGFSWFIENVFPHIPSDYQLLIIGPYKDKKSFSEKINYFLGDKWMLFLGYPSDEIKLRKLIKENQRIEHLGKLPTETIQIIFEHSEAFLMPNIEIAGDMEGFGLVCLEASVGGALVLAANIDGVPSAIQNEKNGILIESGNSESWIKSIENLSFLKSKRQQFTNFTKENYSWEIMVKSYYQLFKKLL